MTRAMPPLMWSQFLPRAHPCGARGVELGEVEVRPFRVLPDAVHEHVDVAGELLSHHDRPSPMTQRRELGFDPRRPDTEAPARVITLTTASMAELPYRADPGPRTISMRSTTSNENR